MSKGDTGEARLQGREVLLMSKDGTTKAEFPGRGVLLMSKDDTGLPSSVKITQEAGLSPAAASPGRS